MARTEQLATEKNLLETLERVERNKSAYDALYINIEKIKPQKRHPLFIKLLAKLFDDVVGTAEGNLYILSNGDFVILGKNISQNIIEGVLKKLQIGLMNDPILLSHNGADLISLYEFPADFDIFKQTIMSLMARLETFYIDVKKQPIDASQVDGIIEHLNNINIAEIVKHQSVIRINGANDFKVLFQEFFVAVKDLSAQYDASIDLVANKWIFMYLSQILDKKTILSFMLSTIKNLPSTIALNLNLSSVFSGEFANLTTNFLRNDQKVIVEVQLVDVFNNLSLYFEAKNALQQKGYDILIDGLTPQSIKMVNAHNLCPNMIKIFWDPMMEFDEEDEKLKNFINDFGADNIVLAKCKDLQAIRWGIKYGIRNFQGPYMDMLEVATIKKDCPHGKECSSEECLKRKRLIAGTYREECKDKNSLEKLLGF